MITLTIAMLLLQLILESGAQAKMMPFMPGAPRPIAIADVAQIKGEISISYRKSQNVFGNYLFKNGKLNLRKQKKQFSTPLTGPGAITFQAGKILWLATTANAGKTSVEVLPFRSTMKRIRNKKTWQLSSEVHQSQLWQLYGEYVQQIIKGNNLMGNLMEYHTSTIDFQQASCAQLSNAMIDCKIPFIINTPMPQSLSLNP